MKSTIKVLFINKNVRQSYTVLLEAVDRGWTVEVETGRLTIKLCCKSSSLALNSQPQQIFQQRPATLDTKQIIRYTEPCITESHFICT